MHLTTNEGHLMRRSIAIGMAAAIAAISLGGTANAAATVKHKPTKAQIAIMAESNRECRKLRHTIDADWDTRWYDCVVGAFVLKDHSYIDQDYVKVKGTKIVLRKRPKSVA